MHLIEILIHFLHSPFSGVSRNYEYTLPESFENLKAKLERSYTNSADSERSFITPRKVSLPSERTDLHPADDLKRFVVLS